jgi:hypothetical protein
MECMTPNTIFKNTTLWEWISLLWWRSYLHVQKYIYNVITTHSMISFYESKMKLPSNNNESHLLHAQKYKRTYIVDTNLSLDRFVLWGYELQPNFFCH